MISKEKPVAVTGALGRSGRHICNALEGDGYTVIRIDVTAPDNPFYTPSRQVDLTRYGDVVANLHGCGAVVHFGANPWPDLDFFAGADRFANNTVGTFNVFQAAAQLGIGRVVWASSETVQGFPYEKVAPVRLPIAEDDAAMPQCAYAMSKLACEGLAQQFAAQFPITLIGLRLAHVVYAENGDVDLFRAAQADASERRAILWKYVEIRDVVTAVMAGLTAEISGAEVFNIAAADTVMDTPTATLFAEHFPATALPDNLPEFGSPMDLSKAKAQLGWAPQISWRDILS